jgi:hypothetical protein
MKWCTLAVSLFLEVKGQSTELIFEFVYNGAVT